MNQTHIHLLITHLPIVGSILGALVLAHGLWTRSTQTMIAAYNIFILCAVGAGIAYITGEAAEETIENIPGISKNVVEDHEDSAMSGLVSLIVLGVFSVGGLLMSLRKSPLARKVAIVIFLTSLISFGLIARTGYIGGKIRHTEIMETAAIPFGDPENGDED